MTLRDSALRAWIMPLAMSLALMAVILTSPSVFANSADHSLRQSARALLEGAPEVSTSYAAEVLKTEPRSRLGYWLKAQSLATLSGTPMPIGEADEELIAETRVRLEETPLDRIPRNLVLMPRSAARQVPVLLVDTSISRLYVFESRNGRPVLIDEFYTSIGLLGVDKQREGDQKTPLGVYRIQFEIQNPRRDGFLGQLAMTLDYPNALDRHVGRTGSGIWIHGVPSNVHVRPPLASDGCLAISNRDIQRLRRYVRYNQTQIVVAPKVEWLSPKEWDAESQRVVRALESVSSSQFAGGVFYVDERWPLVVTQLKGNDVARREYFQSLPKGLRRLLEEPLS